MLSGAGTFTCPLRSVRHSGNDATLAQLPAGAPLDLVRDPGNEVDPNAIQVQHQGVFLGWIAREIARPLATRAPPPVSTRSSPPTRARSHNGAEPTSYTSTTQSS
ncbi:HIRAN domain-containing protein [Streptomyces sp. enrichment culture]|uniref:HIRAN domain-containing protein n=1 Tax=Streptomyces sp. enrichment culture TaxID=1795815 RepID=UPI003F56FA72